MSANIEGHQHFLHIPFNIRFPFTHTHTHQRSELIKGMGLHGSLKQPGKAFPNDSIQTTMRLQIEMRRMKVRTSLITNPSPAMMTRTRNKKYAKKTT